MVATGPAHLQFALHAWKTFRLTLERKEPARVGIIKVTPTERVVRAGKAS